MDSEEQRLYNVRLRSLKVVLVLSIIGSGMSLLSSLAWGFGAPARMMDSGTVAVPSELTVAIEQLLQIPSAYFLCSALLYAGSLCGVILMWKLRKSGFHLYTLSQLLLLVVKVFFLGREQFSIGELMFTLLFVVYYFVALRRLGVFSQDRVAVFTIEKGSDNEEEEE